MLVIDCYLIMLTVHIDTQITLYIYHLSLASSLMLLFSSL